MASGDKNKEDGKNNHENTEDEMETEKSPDAKLTDLINFYSEPDKWTTEESRKGWKNYETEEDGFAPNAYGDEASGDEEGRKFLYYREKRQIINTLSTSAPEVLLDRAQQSLPSGLVLTNKQLLAAVHPDRFRKKDEKDIAHNVFIALTEELKKANAEGIHGFKETEDVSIDFLEDYHEEAHQQATPHLITLYEAYEKEQNIDPTSDDLADPVKQAYDELEKINEEIEKKNKEILNESEFGVIDVDQITNGWIRSREPNNLLWKLCEARHYPIGWAYEPPQSKFEYEVDRGQYWAPMRDRITNTLDTFWNQTLRDYPREYSIDAAVHHILTVERGYEEATTELNNANSRPKRLNIINISDVMAHYCGLKFFSKELMTEQFGNLRTHLERYLVSDDLPLTWLPGDVGRSMTAQSDLATQQIKKLENGKLTINTTPNTVDCTAKPGYTPSGEKIVCIQELGFSSARFVVESPDGSRSLVKSGSSGGKIAIDQAKAIGIPRTITDKNDIAKMRNELLRGEPCQLTYVAIGEWDTTRRMMKGDVGLPNLVVGIFLSGSEYHFSKSAFADFEKSNTTAEALIVQSLGGDKDQSLLSLLMSRVSLEGFSDLFGPVSPAHHRSQAVGPLNDKFGRIQQEVDDLKTTQNDIKDEIKKISNVLEQLALSKDK